MALISDWFEKIDSDEAARSQAKQGSYGGLAFVAMNLVGMAVIYYYSTNSSTGEALASEDVMYVGLGYAILIPVQLFLVYRIYNGKGWLASIVLIAWFLVEVGTKVANGTTNVGWVICYVFLTVMLVNGFRGCWYLKKNQESVKNAS